MVEGDLPEGLRLALEAEKVAQRLGARAMLRWMRGRLVGLWFELGNWDHHPAEGRRADINTLGVIAVAALQAVYRSPGRGGRVFMYRPLA